MGNNEMCINKNKMKLEINIHYIWLIIFVFRLQKSFLCFHLELALVFSFDHFALLVGRDEILALALVPVKLQALLLQSLRISAAVPSWFLLLSVHYSY